MINHFMSATHLYDTTQVERAVAALVPIVNRLVSRPVGKLSPGSQHKTFSASSDAFFQGFVKFCPAQASPF